MLSATVSGEVMLSLARAMVRYLPEVIPPGSPSSRHGEWPRMRGKGRQNCVEPTKQLRLMTAVKMTVESLWCVKWLPSVDLSYILKESSQEHAHSLKRLCEKGQQSCFIYWADLRILGAGLNQTTAITRATAHSTIDRGSLFLFMQCSSPVHTRQV